MSRSFFDRPVLEVAPELLGAVLMQGSVAVRLTEVEAYDGTDDPASHAFRGLTRRNAVMFEGPGLLYVYFTYGMHYCANVVCGPRGRPSAVLLRAGEVTDGLAEARAHRPGIAPDAALARGPANLVRTLGLGPQDNGRDVCTDDSLRLHPGQACADRVRCGPRVGVSSAADRPWRFWLADEPSVSAYRPAVRRIRSGRAAPA
ncbi:MAG TPA: DNA-3-methyladenine glycosylase [Sporichthyaceae bacterium]|nr:DNA-3-methyladenine glycosylase [Sporichthyaceae bacterium]